MERVGRGCMLQGKDLKSITKILRKKTTPWESKLWYYLRGNRFYGLKFKRQVPMGNYVVDFCCQEKSLIIELDGGQHMESQNIEKDIFKQEFLQNNSYKVLRFQNIDVDKNM